MEINNNEAYYEFYERVAILLESNPDMSEEDAILQAKVEMRQRHKWRHGNG